MTCKNSKMLKLTDKYFSSMITTDEEHILMEHLKTCGKCRERYAFIEKLGQVMKKGRAEAPAGFTNKVMINIRRAEIDDTIIERQRRITIFRPVSVTVFSFIMIFAISSLLLIRKTPETVVVKFMVQVQDAREVALVGDFNGWDENATKLKRENGKWIVELKLKPERYQYMFLVNGEKWMTDPGSKEYVNDGYGNKNSVLDITRI